MKDYGDTVLTKQQAEERGLKWKTRWPDCEVGDYFLTGDDFVIQCLKREMLYRNPNKSGSGYRTLRSTFPNNRRLFLRQHIDSKRFDKTKGRFEWNKYNTSCKERARWPWKKADMKKFARLIIRGQDDWAAFLMVYGRHRARINEDKMLMRVVLRSEEFKTMLNDEGKKLLEERGINQVTAVDLIEKAVTLARTSKSPDRVLKVFDRVVELLGMENKGDTGETSFDVIASMEKALLTESTEGSNGGSMEVQEAEQIEQS